MKKHKKTEIYMVYVCENCGQEAQEKGYMSEHEEICKQYLSKRVRQTKRHYPQPDIPEGTFGTCTRVVGRLVYVRWDNGFRDRYFVESDPLEIVKNEPVTK